MTKFAFQDDDTAATATARLNALHENDPAIIDFHTLNYAKIQNMAPDMLLAFITHEKTTLSREWQTQSNGTVMKQAHWFRDERDKQFGTEHITPHVQTVFKDSGLYHFTDNQGRAREIIKKQSVWRLKECKEPIVSDSLTFYPQYLIEWLLANNRTPQLTSEQEEAILSAIAKKFIVATKMGASPSPSDTTIMRDATQYFGKNGTAIPASTRLLGEIQYQLVGQHTLKKQTQFSNGDTVKNVKQVLDPIATWRGRLRSLHWNTKGGDLVNNNILNKVTDETTKESLKTLCLDTLNILTRQQSTRAARHPGFFSTHKPRLTGETAKRIRFILNNAETITARRPSA